MAAEFLVVGLGNPGEEYRFTPHNMGFLVIDQLAESNSIRVTRKENTSLVGLGKVKGKDVALAQPQTYMNLSGSAVKGLLDRYELKPSQLVVVYDELALPWGQLRIRKNGSSAGHNGIKSLIGSLGSDEFFRLRIGIHPEQGRGDAAKFVLAPFKRAQMKEVEDLVIRSAAAVESIIAEGAEKAMATYNRRAEGLKNEEE
ncbi:MAG: aminoacyl-tRNA hydrolase [Bryobacteraceae bacterium]